MNERSAYLIQRLNRGEITLEEARELFRGMAEDLKNLRRKVEEQVPPPVPQAPPPSSLTPSREVNAVNLEDMLLVLGAASGIFAALVKRFRE